MSNRLRACVVILLAVVAEPLPAQHAAALAPVPLTAPAAVAGALDASTRRWTPLKNDRAVARYRDYTYSAAAGERIAVELRSAEFDALLALGRLHQGRFLRVAWDDDGAGGTDARLEYTFPTDGEYVVRASSVDEETGAYRLSVSRLAAVPSAAPGAKAGAVSRSALRAGDPQLPGRGSAHAYAMQLRRGDRVEVTLEAEGFDSYLRVVSPSGALVENDDAEGSSYHLSRVSASAHHAGTWMVLVTSAEEGASGSYGIRLEPGHVALRRLPAAAVREHVAAVRALALADTLQDDGEFAPPDSALTLLRRARRLRDAHRAELPSVESLEKEAELHRYLSRAHARLGEVDSAAAQGRLAVAFYRRAGGQPESDPRAWEREGLLREAEELEAAIEWLQENRGRGPSRRLRLEREGPRRVVVRGILTEYHPEFPSGGFADAYEFQARRGDTIRAVLDRELGGMVMVTAPSGTYRLNYDSIPTVERVAAEDGPWMVWVTKEHGAGRYTLTLEKTGTDPLSVVKYTPEQVAAYTGALVLAQGERPLYVSSGLTEHTADGAARLERSARAWFAVNRERMGLSALERAALAYEVSSPGDARRIFRELLTRARGSGNTADQHRALAGLGRVASVLHGSDSAFVYLHAALATARQSGDLSAEAAMLQHLGVEHQRAGTLDSAMVTLSLALEVAERARDQRWIDAARNAMAGIRSMLGRESTARSVAERDIATALEQRNWRSYGRALGRLAGVLELEGRPDSAVSFYQRALRELRDADDRHGEAEMLRGLASAHAQQANGDSAVALSRLALQVAHELGDKRLQGTVEAQLGWLLLDLGRPDSAAAHHARALLLAREVNDRWKEGFQLGEIARSYRAMRGGTGRALAYYDSALAVLGTVRRRAGEDAERISVAEQFTHLSREWAYLMLRTFPDSTGSVFSLAAVESGRAKALVDQMRSSRDATEEHLEPLFDHLAALRERGTTVLAYDAGPDTLLLWLMTPDGGVRAFQAPSSEATLAEMVARVRLTIRVDSGAIRAVGGDLELRDRGVRRRAASSAGSYEQELRTLAAAILPDSFAALVPPDADLVIVPHGPLTLVPFVALPVEGLPLGHRVRLRYAPSIASLMEAEQRPKTIAHGEHLRIPSALVVGDPTMPAVLRLDGSREVLTQLPGAAREAGAVAERVGAAVLSGSAATERRVVDQMPGAPLVHLATHGFAFGSEARARHSFVALAPGEGEDGLLTVGEILDELPSLTADLFVLSACQTGLGDLKSSEGTVGLQWALLAKGARTVLVTLWSIDDDVTQTLMERFYHHWTSGASKAEALRRAQREVARTHPNPRYWAGFQLVGAD